MAKNQQWKKAIRAQVAATLQGSVPGQAPTPSVMGNVPKSTATAQPNPDQGSEIRTGYRQDLVRIFWVALEFIAHCNAVRGIA